MGRIVRSLLLAVGLLVASAGVVHGDGQSDLGTDSGSVALLGDSNSDQAGDVSRNWLIGLQAGAARVFAKDTSVDGSERFRLVLRDVAPVTMFSDRPIRESHFVSPKALVTNWETWFAQDAPNALISVPRAGAAPESVVVTLKNPRWDQVKRQLVFEVVRESTKHDPVVTGQNWTRPEVPRRASSVSIFIDGTSAMSQWDPQGQWESGGSLD